MPLLPMHWVITGFPILLIKINTSKMSPTNLRLIEKRHLACPDCKELQGVFGVKLKNKPKQSVRFHSYGKSRLATPVAYGDLQITIWWHGVPEWWEKAKGEHFEL